MSNLPFNGDDNLPPNVSINDDEFNEQDIEAYRKRKLVQEDEDDYITNENQTTNDNE